jgi:HAD superfamily hydrolase (TIGR01549 family)
MGTIKTVIFDLDGTITEPFFDFDAIRQEIGISDNAISILDAFEQMSDEDRRVAEAILKKHENAAVSESTLNKGTEKTLDVLRQSSINIGILTRNTKDNTAKVAEKHNLKFDAIVDRNDGPVKPDAFGVLKLCKIFSTRPDETLVVGDYLHDLLCAKAAGAFAVLMKTHKNSDDFEPHADYVISTLDEILEIIENKKKQN